MADRAGADERDLVFVSYSHRDQPWLDRLLVLLTPLVRNKRMKVWADPYLQIGSDWRRSLYGAIDQADVAVLLVSGDFLASRFIIEEELPALAARGVRLAPVLLRDCLWEHEPLLDQVQWAYGRGGDGPLDSGADDPASRDGRLVQVCRRLIAVVDSTGSLPPADEATFATPTLTTVEALVESPRLGVMDGAPPLPPGYVERIDLDDLRAAVLEAATGAVGVTGNAAALGLHGQGGIGKSVLAAALAAEERVRAYFPDGVFWVTLGERADPVSAQVDLLARLGRPGLEVRSASDGLGLLRETLAGRQVLLVVDDVWSDAAAAAFRAAGPAGRVLYTSRDARVLAAVDARLAQVDVLPEQAARHLLSRISGTSVEALPAESAEIVAATGRVPLALALVAAAVRGGMSWARLAAALREGTETFLDHPYANTFKAMQVATAALPADLRAAYVSLAVYPPDTNVPIDVVARFWAHQFGIGADQVRNQLEKLAESELLRLVADQVSFHDLQHDYLVLRAEDLAVLHADLLATYRELLPEDEWARLPADEPYVWSHLIHHLFMAGDRAGLRTTATDAAYLARRIAYHGTHAAEADLIRATEIMPDDTLIEWWRQWLARHGHLFRGLQVQGDVAATMRCWLGDPGARAGTDARRLDLLLPASFLRPTWGLAPVPAASFRTLTHPGPIAALAFGRGGKSLASGGLDGTVRLWDVEAGTEQTFTVPTEYPTAMAFSTDGRLVAVGNFRGVVRLWNVESCTELAVLKQDGRKVSGLVFSPDGRYLATTSGRVVRLWHLESGVQRAASTQNKDDILQLAFSSSGSSLACVDKEAVKLWDVESLTLRVTVDRRAYGTLAVSPIESLLAGAVGGAIEFFDIESGRRTLLKGHSENISQLLFSPNGSHLSVGTKDGAVGWWDVRSGTVQAALKGHAREVSKLVFGPDGRLLASADDGGRMRLWVAHSPGGRTTPNKNTPKTQAMAPGDWERSGTDVEKPRAVADKTRGGAGWYLDPDNLAGRTSKSIFSSDGQLIAFVSHDGTVQLWDVKSGSERLNLHKQDNSVMDVAIRADGRVLACARHGDGAIRVWDMESGSERILRWNGGSFLDSIARTKFSPDGRALFSVHPKGVIRLWDVDTGTKVAELGHSISAVALGFSPNGRQFTVGNAGELMLWRLEPSGVRAERHRLSGVLPRALSFSPDGRSAGIITGGEGILVWDVESRTRRAMLVGHRGKVLKMALSTDGGLLAAVDQYNALHLWDTKSGTHRVELYRHREDVVSVMFSPDDLLLASADAEGFVRLFDVQRRSLLHLLPLNSRISSAVWGTHALAVTTPDSLIMLTAGTPAPIGPRH